MCKHKLCYSNVLAQKDLMGFGRTAERLNNLNFYGIFMIDLFIVPVEMFMISLAIHSLWESNFGQLLQLSHALKVCCGSLFFSSSSWRQAELFKFVLEPLVSP